MTTCYENKAVSISLAINPKKRTEASPMSNILHFIDKNRAFFDEYFSVKEKAFMTSWLNFQILKRLNIAANRRVKNYKCNLRLKVL